MATCSTCGNDYDMTFQVTTNKGEQYDFDSIECAVRPLRLHDPGSGHPGELDDRLLRQLRPARRRGGRERQHGERLSTWEAAPPVAAKRGGVSRGSCAWSPHSWEDPFTVGTPTVPPPYRPQTSTPGSV